jgi:hypothetical protein
MEAMCSTETSEYLRFTWRYNPENRIGLSRLWELQIQRFKTFHEGKFMNDFYILGYNAVQCGESQQTFHSNMSPPGQSVCQVEQIHSISSDIPSSEAP